MSKRKAAIEAERRRAQEESERLAEERELAKELELTGTNRRIEAQKKAEREAREAREKAIRGFIESGSKMLIQIGMVGSQDEQKDLARRAGLCFSEALVIEPDDPKATFGLEQAIATEEAIAAAERAAIVAKEVAAQRAREAEEARLVYEQQQKEQAGFNLARRISQRTMGREARRQRRVLLTGAASALGTSLRLHWAHGSVMDAELWKKISPPGSETWRQYDAPYSLVLVDERAIPAEQLGTHETFFQVDCADYGGLRRACEGVDTVVHLGGVAQEEMMAHVHEPDAFHLSMLRPCILQAFNVFHAATDAGCRRVVYASSAHSVAGNVYGRHSAREGVETDDDVPTYKLVRGMTVGQVGQWLKSIGFEEYKYTFQRHQVDGTVLCRFRQQDDGGLMIMKRDLDIAHLGHRNRILEALEKLWKGEPAEGDLTDWRQARCDLASEHQSCPNNLYGAAHCWGEALARVYSRVGVLPSRRPTADQAFASGLGEPWQSKKLDERTDEDMARTAELDMGWLLTGETADTAAAAKDRAAAAVAGLWAPTPHAPHARELAVGGGVRVETPLSCVVLRLGWLGFRQYDPWCEEHPSFGLSPLDCAQLFTRAVDTAKLGGSNGDEEFFAIAHGVSRHKRCWLALDETEVLLGYRPVDGTAFPRHPPPPDPEPESESDEDEEKGLATHTALRRTVVREGCDTRSARVGQLAVGDLVLVHESQMGGKGVERLRCTVLPDPMPEEVEFDVLGRPIDPLKDALVGWVSASAPNGTQLVATVAEARTIAEAAARAEEADQKPWTDPTQGDRAHHEVRKQRLLAAEHAGREAPRGTLPEEAAASSLIAGLETPDAREARLAAEQAAIERAERERKEALAAQAAQSQAAIERRRREAELEAERLRAEEAAAAAAARKVPVGFDLVRKEQQGHRYDHDSATLRGPGEDAEEGGGAG